MRWGWTENGAAGKDFSRAQNQQEKVLLTIDLGSKLPSGELKPVH